MTINKRHIYYWIGPAIVGGLLVGLYFSGIPWMQSFVAPEINREFGALESLEHLLLLAITLMAIQGIRRKPTLKEKWALTFGAVGSFFLLLEEIDYGIHYLEYFRGELFEGKRNLHNFVLNPYGLDFDAVVSPIVYVVLGVFFCVLPLIIMKDAQPFWSYLKIEPVMARLSARPWLRYITPEPYSIGTIAAMVLVVQVAFFLDKIDVHSNHELKGNISEFGELFVHYLLLLYVVEMVCKRKTPHTCNMKTLMTLEPMRKN
jgi:hypothetical protein